MQVLLKLKNSVRAAKSYWDYLFLAVSVALLVFFVYWHDIEVLVNEALQSEALNYVLIVPFFAGYLFYAQRRMVYATVQLDARRPQARTKYVNTLVGVSFCLIAFLIYWYGTYTFHPLEYHLLSLPVFLLGVILILFNMKTLKTLLLSTLFLLFIMPPPAEIVYAAGGALASFNTQAAYLLLRTFELPVTLSTVYGAPTLTLEAQVSGSTSFTVDLPCSGVYTLIAFTMFAVFLALALPASSKRKAGIFIVGFSLFAVLNIVRIASIVSAAYFFGEQVALVFFHSFAGLLLITIGMILTFLIVDKLFKKPVYPKAQPLQTCETCRTNRQENMDFCSECGRFSATVRRKLSRSAWTKLALLAIGCSIAALTITAPAFALAQNSIEVTSGWEHAANVFPTVPDYTLKFLYRAASFEKIAKQDAALIYAYYSSNTSAPTVYALINVADSISNLHSWEVCFITYQTAQGQNPIVTVLDSRDVQILENPPLIAHYLTFEHPDNYTQVTLYWYEKATFHIGITAEQKYVRISLLIRLEQNRTDYKALEEKLYNFSKMIAEHWAPLKTQTALALGIPAQQLLLALSLGFVITAETAQRSTESRKRSNNLKIFNNTATPEEKLMLQTILDLTEEKKAFTTKEIAAALSRKTGKPVNLDKLLENLNQLESYGFIDKDVVSRGNQPVQVWKNRLPK